MQINEMIIAIGRVRMTTRALGRWNKKTMQTALTASESFIISSFKVSMERRMRSDLS